MSVKNILYGTQNYVSHFVKTCSPREKSEGKDDCSLHTSFFEWGKGKEKSWGISKQCTNNKTLIQGAIY